MRWASQSYEASVDVATANPVSQSILYTLDIQRVSLSCGIFRVASGALNVQRTWYRSHRYEALAYRSWEVEIGLHHLVLRSMISRAGGLNQ